MAHDRTHLLIVDDQADNLLVLEQLLEDCGELRTFTDGSAALAFLRSGGRADLILLDVVMPHMDGFEVCRRIKAMPGLRHVPVLLLTGLGDAADEELGLSLGAADFIHRPAPPAVVRARVRTHLSLHSATRQLQTRNRDLERLAEERADQVLRQSQELLRREQQVAASQAAIIAALCAVAEVRDSETGNHILRTRQYVKVLAERLCTHPDFRDELTEERVALLLRSAPLHDVGKVAIPDHILLKPGPLTPTEWEIMQRHTLYGRDVIARAEGELGASQGEFLRQARDVALSHHERWDGRGYPEGLAGDAIPLSARLMAVADVYDALISPRAYKRPYTHQQAIAMMAEQRGAQFDPRVLDCLLEIQDEFRRIADFYNDPTQPIREYSG